jgi:hypothetical protein
MHFRKHLFADMQPYTCLYDKCAYVMTPFANRQLWSAHLEIDHKLGPDWRSAECPLCRETTGTGKSATLIHFARHMEDIALAALPRGVEEEACSESEFEAESKAESQAESQAESEQEIEPEPKPEPESKVDLAPQPNAEHTNTISTSNSKFLPKLELEREAGVDSEADIQNSISVPGRGINKCSNCGKVFVGKFNFADHRKECSSIWKCPVKECKYANIEFSTEKELIRHQNDKHASPPAQYKCRYPPCTYASKRESNCKQHMEKAHGGGWNQVRSTGYRQKKRPHAAAGERDLIATLPGAPHPTRLSSPSRSLPEMPTTDDIDGLTDVTHDNDFTLFSTESNNTQTNNMWPAPSNFYKQPTDYDNQSTDFLDGFTNDPYSFNFRVNTKPFNFTSTPLDSTSTPLDSTSTPFNFTSTPLDSTSTPFNFTSTPLDSTSTPFNFTSTPFDSTSTPFDFTSAPFDFTSTRDLFNQPDNFNELPADLDNQPTNFVTQPVNFDNQPDRPQDTLPDSNKPEPEFDFGESPDESPEVLPKIS